MASGHLLNRPIVDMRSVIFHTVPFGCARDTEPTACGERACPRWGAKRPCLETCGVSGTFRRLISGLLRSPTRASPLATNEDPMASGHLLNRPIVNVRSVIFHTVPFGCARDAEPIVCGERACPRWGAKRPCLETCGVSGTFRRLISGLLRSPTRASPLATNEDPMASGHLLKIVDVRSVIFHTVPFGCARDA
ncbi:hypothetical protein LRS56_07005 [Pseudomonas poae]|nr:hypothetical protein LRS56_07005 [Pseudomonas poae]